MLKACQYFIFHLGTQVSDSTKELLEELQQWELTEIYDVLSEEAVTKSILWTLNEEDLNKLGIKWIQRKKYFRAVEQIKKMAEVSGKKCIVEVTCGI